MDVLITFYGGKKYDYMSIVQNCTMLEGAIAAAHGKRISRGIRSET